MYSFFSNFALLGCPTHFISLLEASSSFFNTIKEKESETISLFDHAFENKEKGSISAFISEFSFSLIFQN
jgi:phosphoribosylaminoimidazole-succinocarboxamide synthase